MYSTKGKKKPNIAEIEGMFCVIKLYAIKS